MAEDTPAAASSEGLLGNSNLERVDDRVVRTSTVLSLSPMVFRSPELTKPRQRASKSQREAILENYGDIACIEVRGDDEDLAWEMDERPEGFGFQVLCVLYGKSSRFDPVGWKVRRFDAWSPGD